MKNLNFACVKLALIFCWFFLGLVQSYWILFNCVKLCWKSRAKQNRRAHTPVYTLLFSICQ